MHPNKPGTWIINDETLIDIFPYEETFGCHVSDQHGNLWPMKVEFLPEDWRYRHVDSITTVPHPK